MWKIILFLLNIIIGSFFTYNVYITEPHDKGLVLVGASIFIMVGFGIWFLMDIQDEFSKQHNAINCHIFVIKRKTMEILKKFKNFFLLNTRDKRFMKLGIVNNDNELTEEGKELYKSWRFEKDRDEFDKEVAQKLEEKK